MKLYTYTINVYETRLYQIVTVAPDEETACEQVLDELDHEEYSQDIECEIIDKELGFHD